ncbi:hypothetical protein BKA69DRAFT_1124694 [Paraphysoderma sedebokerense]|nr:hypothetical protein BKA69DRAFT_1124694 [Paraphysoderma sedebokerense]
MKTELTRIIVKNLPKHITEQRFREHFAEKGEVTDARLMKTKAGVFRRFGYIGYKSEKDAKEAANYFHKTFIDTSRIQVELALPIGDSSLARPWSRYSVGSSAYEQKLEGERRRNELRQQRNSKSNGAVEIVHHDDETKGHRVDEGRKSFIESLYAAEEGNDKLKEYLEVMQPRSQARTWSNDVGSVDSAKPMRNDVNSASVTSSKIGKPSSGEGSDDEDYQDLPSKDASDDSFNIDNEVDNAGMPLDSAISDQDYLKSRLVNLDDLEKQIELNSNSDDIAENDSEDNNKEIKELANLENISATEITENADNQKVDTSSPTADDKALMQDTIQESEPSPTDIIAETGRLYAINLPYTCTEEELASLFEQYGPISEIHLPISSTTKQPKGFAFILYFTPEHAIRAYSELDGQFFQGRILRIYPAKAKVEVDQELSSDARSSFKKQKEAKLKSSSSNDFNWNSLYMSADAVASSIADRFNVAKSEILNKDSDNMAVRLALAETHIINETKKFLEENGIILDAFGKKGRSKTVILVKNIPYGTEESELRDLFADFGSLGRILLPPAKTIGIVEFLEPNEAKSAFKHLAYKKFKNLPMYLEFAPTNVFREKYDPKKHKPKASAPSSEQSPSKQDIGTVKTSTSLLEAGSVDESADTATLFVKNLNFITSDETLCNIFQNVDGFRSARIKYKNDTKNPGKKLSMGFGFVEFNNKDTAMKALKTLQHVNIDNHALELKFSNRDAAPGSVSVKRKGGSSKGDDKGTKLVIRNVPFEATKKDLRELFNAYGHIKSLRLPLKVTGGHRGFAFIEFLTHQDAKHVYESLAGTHLYGRHLVLEWAEEVGNADDEIDKLREKTGKGFRLLKGGAKKRKVVIDGEEGMDEAMEE